MNFPSTPRESPPDSWKVLDHPADEGFEAWGPDRAAAFAAAVRALSSLLSGGRPVAPSSGHPVHLDAPDDEHLLVRLLEEVLYLLEVRGYLSADAHLSVTDGSVLRGKLVGEPYRPDRHGGGTPVKAITWHQLSVRSTGETCRVTVYVDL